MARHSVTLVLIALLLAGCAARSEAIRIMSRTGGQLGGPTANTTAAGWDALLRSSHQPAAAVVATAGQAPALHLPLAAAKADFLAHAGKGRYGYAGWMDEQYASELGDRLGRGQHYLDFTGSGLYTRSQLMAATQLLADNVFGNPHSRSASSMRTALQEEEARAQVLHWLSADPDEYVLVWTRSATEALKLVGETFPWSPAPGWTPARRVTPGGASASEVGLVSACGADVDAPAGGDTASRFVYTRANHKSVLGIGAYAQEKGALLRCVDAENVDAWLHSSSSSSTGAAADPTTAAGDSATTYSLLAFAAKDNFEGRLYPLDWIAKAHARSTPRHRWLVMLDAAAYVPTHALNLTAAPADFVALSFYKVLGFPTGVGALVMRKDAAAVLHKVYFGGGAVDAATAEDVWRLLLRPPEGFQDGTIDFLGIAQLTYGLQQLEALGGMEAVHAHVSSLQEWTYAALTALRHSNGAPLLRIFGKHADAPAEQSGIFQFLVLRADGSVVATEDVEVTAGAAGVQLRSGCHCNPGLCLRDLGILPEEFRAASLAHNMSGSFITVMRQGPGDAAPRPVQLPTGSVRASLGSLSTFEDVWALVDFLRATYVDASEAATHAAAVAARAKAAVLAASGRYASLADIIKRGGV